MTTSSAGLIVSGRDYTVVEVSGRPATHLDDFTGETSFVLSGDAEPHLIPGVGAATADGVRFHQKDPQLYGRDVRVWRISESPDGDFLARHDAAI